MPCVWPSCGLGQAPMAITLLLPLRAVKTAAVSREPGCLRVLADMSAHIRRSCPRPRVPPLLLARLPYARQTVLQQQQ